MFSPVLVALALAAHQQPPGTRGRRPEVPPATAPPSAPASGQTVEAPVAPPSVTHHTVDVHGSRLAYTATAGFIPIRNRDGGTDGTMFYIAYTKDGVADPARRPLTFAFNGGPGSASVWLHLGCIGPRRVALNDDGGMPQPPYHLVDNDETWLTDTDLVFIDPVGTGYSRPAKPELGAKFWGLTGDIESVGEFIRMYLTQSQRWGSPLFLAGESYGTTRAAGLSDYLVGNGIALNGIVLISTVLNFQTLDGGKLNDLPPEGFLPSFCAIAWYHHKLSAAMEADFNRTMEHVRRFASTDYAAALAAGDSLPAARRLAIADQVAGFTGLSRQFVLNHDLRINEFAFMKELFRDQRRSVGRLDGRFLGIEPNGVGEGPAFDPSEAAIRSPFTSTFNQYIRGELNFKSDLTYYILGGGITTPWNWDTRRGGYPDVSESLRSAFAQNPYMKVMIACGYYDLATPFAAVQYTLDHMGIDAAVRANVSLDFFNAGHMMYIDTPSRRKLATDVLAFMHNATAPARLDHVRAQEPIH